MFIKLNCLLLFLFFSSYSVNHNFLEKSGTLSENSRADLIFCVSKKPNSDIPGSKKTEDGVKPSIFGRIKIRMKNFFRSIKIFFCKLFGIGAKSESEKSELAEQLAQAQRELAEAQAATAEAHANADQLAKSQAELTNVKYLLNQTEDDAAVVKMELAAQAEELTAEKSKISELMKELDEQLKTTQIYKEYYEKALTNYEKLAKENETLTANLKFMERGLEILKRRGSKINNVRGVLM